MASNRHDRVQIREDLCGHR